MAIVNAVTDPEIIESRCEACGAVITISAAQRTERCPFCDAPSVVTRPAAPGRPQPAFVLGFAVERAEAARTVTQWIRGQKMPLLGLTAGVIERITGVYLPAYLYSSTALSQYQASIGETYRVLGLESDDDGGVTLRRGEKMEYRDLVGRRMAYVADILVSASRGLANHEIDAIEPFDLGQLRRYSPALLAGWTSEEPTLTRDECFQLARTEAQEHVDHELRQFMPGDEIRSLRHETQFVNESLELALVPVWVCAVRSDPRKRPVRVLGQRSDRQDRRGDSVPVGQGRTRGHDRPRARGRGADHARRPGEQSPMTRPSPDCPRCGSAIETGDLRCPVCHLAVPQATGAGDGAAAIRVETFRCASCGAAMEYQARVQAPHCAFCGSVLILERHADPAEQTEAYLPFTMDRKTAADVYRRWLSTQGFFQPSNLASAARLESLRALWWVGWTVKADAVVSWTLDSDAGARRAGWAPHAGEFQRVFENIVIPATRGLSAAECGRLIPTYALASGVEPSAMANGAAAADRGAVRERFEMSRSAARRHIVSAIQYLAASRVTSSEAPGTRFRNVHAAVHLRGLRTRRLAFPAYAIAYRYRGQLYRTVISGQDPSCIIGQIPRSLAKVILLIALILAGLAAAAIGLAFLLVSRSLR